MPSNFGEGSYNVEIHEMSEARAFGMGQYSHNNQPVGYNELLTVIIFNI